MTSSTLEPREIAAVFTPYRPGHTLDSNTFKNAMLAAAENLALQIFQLSQLSWVRQCAIVQVDLGLLLKAEQLVVDARGGFGSVEDMLALLEQPRHRHHTLGTWMGHDLYLLLLRDLIESGSTSIYDRKHHNQLMQAIGDAVELIANTYLWGHVLSDFPEGPKGQALARLLVNWQPIRQLTPARPALVRVHGTVPWVDRLAFEAAVVRLEDELIAADFRGTIHLHLADRFVITESTSQFDARDYVTTYGRGTGVYLDILLFERFEQFLAEELARPIVEKIA